MIFNMMVLEYARLNLTYQPHNVTKKFKGLKIITEEREKEKKHDEKEEVLGDLMAATQNNLIKMHNTQTHKETNLEIKNYYMESKPMFRMTRAFQWGHD